MEEQTTKVDYNAAQFLSQEILNLRVKATRFFIAHDWENFFYTIKSSKMLAIASINKTDRDKLTQMEKEIASIFLKIKTTLKSKHEDYPYYKAKVAKQCEAYNQEVMDVLQKKGFLMGKKADISRFGNVKIDLEED